MSQHKGSPNAQYPEHAPEPLYDRLADRPFSPEDIPDADTEIHVGLIYKRAFRMSAEEREETAGSRSISATGEKLLHKEVYGVGFRGPVTVSFNPERHGNGLSELRLSVSNSPHGGYGEDAHRAFRTDPITAGEYRRKYRVMLQEYDDNRKSQRKVQETKNRIQNRIDAVKTEIKERAQAHPKIPEKGETWAKRFGKVKRIELPDGAQLSVLEPSDRGRGVDLKAQRLDPALAFRLVSILREGKSELVSLVGRISQALQESGHSALREDLFEFLDTGETVDW
jgi:hypothetical protein